MIINYRRVTDSAIVPTFGTEDSGGIDLYADKDAYIEPGKTVMIGTGIAMEIPKGHFGGIYPRSGLATKKGLRLANCVGVVDADYRGEIIVALHNDSSLLREVRKGDRIAQLIVQEYKKFELNEMDELSGTERGDGGFGSTGK